MVTLDLFCAAMASNNYIAERKRANPAAAIGPPPGFRHRLVQVTFPSPIPSRNERRH